jgi:hypothetical protein
VSGGQVSGITVSGGLSGSNSSPTGLTSGPIRVPAGGSITLTYAQAPSWRWIAD